jgi:hypothetical protein
MCQMMPLPVNLTSKPGSAWAGGPTGCSLLVHSAGELWELRWLQQPKHAFIPWCQRKFNTFRCIPGYSEWAEQLADANWPACWATQNPSRRVCTASAGRSLESLVLCGLCVRVVDVGCRLIIYGEHWGAAEQSFALFWFGFSTLLAIEWHECSHVALFPSFCFNRLSLCTIQFEDSKPCQTMPHNVKPKIKPL